MADETSPDPRLAHLKNQIRKAFIDAAYSVGEGRWTVEDDHAMDAAVLWLYGIVRKAPSSTLATDLAGLTAKLRTPA